MSHRTGLLAVVLVFLTVTPALAEEDERPWWAVSTSFNYSVGDYGTGKDTTLIYVPFTLGVTPLERLTVSLTVPYIRQTSQTVVLTGGGVAVRRNEKGKLNTPAQSSVTQTEDGLGDLLLKGSFIVLPEQTVLPEVAPYVKIKFPTADDSRGLGTGEFDETLGVDVSKRLIDRLFGYVSVAYTFVGSPRGEDLRNSFGWSVGAAYAIIQPLSVFAFLDGATAISRGQADPLELRVGAEYKLIKALKLTGSVTRGLSNGSADWGVSAGLALRF
jgi:outer membrane putative beta-barrel porin/alpha-amylase